MAINRFNRFANNDYSMKFHAPEVFLPNFEAWDSLLAKQQQQYDAALSIKNKYPKYLKEREGLAAQYMSEVDNNVNNITTMYTEKGVSAGNRQLRDFGLQLNKAWQPGGLAYELENEYGEYQAAAASIDKYYKDNKAENSANRDYSLAKLKQSVNQPLAFNETTGMYTRNPISPEIIPYVDIADEALKVVKEIKDSGDTKIVQMSPFWFQKIKNEGVTEGAIKAVTDALLQQPKYQQQQQVELWKAKSQYTPEQLNEFAYSKQTQLVNGVSSKLGDLEKLISKGGKEIKKVQEILLENGYYDGSVDGKWGVKSKAAFEQYKANTLEAAQAKAESITPDAILSEQIRNSYAQPLIKAFSRNKTDKDLIYNKEADLKAKLKNQREQTASLVGAIQSLAPNPTSDFLVTPGATSVTGGLSKLKGDADQTIQASNQVLSKIIKTNGIADIAGTADPNTINGITELRLQSKDFTDFNNKLIANGYIGITYDRAQKLFDFYSSPEAADLYNGYESLKEAKAQKQQIVDAELSITEQYAQSSEGQKKLKSVRKDLDFKGTDDELLEMIVNKDPKLKKSGANVFTNINMIGSPQPVSLSVDYSSSFMQGRDAFLKSNKLELPISLRGYTVNAGGGYGKDLENLISDDLKTGYTLGYNGVNFKKVGTDDDVSLKDVDLDGSDIKINATGDKISYYITGKTNDKEKQVVSSLVDAPKEHYDKLRTLSLEMKRQAAETGDSKLDALANNIYRVTTNGPIIGDAVADAVIVNNKNGKRLDSVIDPSRSTKDNLVTFGNNENVIGLPVGEELQYEGKRFQKIKVSNPKQGGQKYMQTVVTTTKDRNGNPVEYYMPVKNKSGGLYYESATEAHNVITDLEMMRQIPVEINQQKVQNTTVDPEQMKGLMLGLDGLLNKNE